MSSKTWFKKLKGKLALMLAIILMFPNTAVAQWIGAGVVTAKAANEAITLNSARVVRNGAEFRLYVNFTLPQGVESRDNISLYYAVVEENADVTGYTPATMTDDYDNYHHDGGTFYQTTSGEVSLGWYDFQKSKNLDTTKRYKFLAAVKSFDDVDQHNGIPSTNVVATEAFSVPLTFSNDELSASMSTSSDHTYTGSQFTPTIVFTPNSSSSERNAILQELINNNKVICKFFQRTDGNGGSVSGIFSPTATVKDAGSYDIYASTEETNYAIQSNGSIGSITIDRATTEAPNSPTALVVTVSDDKESYIVTADSSQATNKTQKTQALETECSFNGGSYGDNTYTAGANVPVTANICYKETVNTLSSGNLTLSTTTPAATDAPEMTASTTFTGTQTVRITAHEGETIYYTKGTNPADPTISAKDGTGTGTVSFDVSETTTVKAFAVADGHIKSDVVEKTYTKQSTSPGPGPGPGPSNKYITGITVSPTSAQLAVGKTRMLQSSFVPADTTEHPVVTWTSNKTGVATVSQTGLVTAVGEGEADITATVNATNGTFTATSKITVVSAGEGVLSLSISPNPATVLKGGTTQLTATVLPEGTTEKPDIKWSSSNTNIAMVSESTGVVMGINTGTATITASAFNGEVSATCDVTVTDKEVELTGIQVSPKPLNVEEGKTAQLTATMVPAEQTENPTVTWKSDNTNVATVDSTGLVKGVKEGTTTVTATVTGSKGTFSDSVNVTVSKGVVEVFGLRFNETLINLKEGNTEKLTAEVIPQNATDKTVTWKSANTAIALVEGDGTVTGVKAGTTSIIASCGGIPAACIVNVTKADLMPGEGNENPDLSDLIKDAEIGGKDIGDIINDVVISKEEDGKETTETWIWVGGIKSSYTFTGGNIEPDVHVYDGVRELTKGNDYFVRYFNNKEVGKDASVNIGFQRKYESTQRKEINFAIVPAVFGTDVIAQDVAVKSKKGNAVVPPIKVVWKKTKNALDAEYYSIAYTDSEGNKVSAPTTAGVYTATITPSNKTDNFTGSMSIKVTVVDENYRNLGAGKVKIVNKKKTWTGEPIELKSNEIVVTDANKNTVDPKYYTVSYLGNHTDTGKATVVITANDSRENGYVGSNKAEFTIVKGKNADDLSFSIEDKGYYSRKGATAKVTVIDKTTNTVLVEGEDYKVSYNKNKEVSTSKTAIARITGKEPYKFTKELNYSVAAMPIENCSITVSDVSNSKKWNKPKVVIKDLSGMTLKTSDYRMTGFKVDGKEITSAPEVGSEITVTIEAKGKNYSGSVEKKYKLINKSEDINGAKVLKKIEKAYEGGPVTLTAEDMTGWLSINNVTLEYGKNFEVIGYESNTEKGTAKVTVRGIAGKSPSGKDLILGGTKIITFKIKEKKGKWNPEGEALIGGEWK